jgi:hypothetical protein
VVDDFSSSTCARTNHWQRENGTRLTGLCVANDVRTWLLAHEAGDNNFRVRQMWGLRNQASAIVFLLKNFELERHCCEPARLAQNGPRRRTLLLRDSMDRRVEGGPPDTYQRIKGFALRMARRYSGWAVSVKLSESCVRCSTPNHASQNLGTVGRDRQCGSGITATGVVGVAPGRARS